MESIFTDIRFAARSLWKRPGFSAIVVLTLALGIGANTAVFSVINAVLLRPLPYRETDRVVTLWQNNSKAGIARNGVSPANFIDWSEQSNSFEAIAGIEPSGFSLVGDGEPERLRATLVTSGFFQAAGTDALLGRTLTAEDYQPGKDRVARVLGCGWQDAIESILLEYAKTFCKDGLNCFPLIKAKIIQQYKESGRAFFNVREYLELK